MNNLDSDDGAFHPGRFEELQIQQKLNLESGENFRLHF
jgi:hypothetical protein